MKKQKKSGSVKKRWAIDDDSGLPVQTQGDYPMEDWALKEAARFMGKELLPLLGGKGSVKRGSPTEAVFLEVGDYLADFNYEMTDRTWKHLEFESDSLSMEDLRRFRAYEAVVSYKYGVDASTYVVCTSKAKVIKNSLIQGKSRYQVDVLRMKDYDADEIIRNLEEKQRAGKSLERGIAESSPDAADGRKNGTGSQDKEKLWDTAKGTGERGKGSDGADAVGAVCVGDESADQGRDKTGQGDDDDDAAGADVGGAWGI